jgi:hypothetical protein
VVRRALALCVLALAAGCGGGGEDTDLALPEGQHFAVARSLTPRASAFGDTLTAELRILLDRRYVDPARVRLLTRFEPYRERRTVERVDDGNLTSLTYTIRLDCLTRYCPSDVPSSFAFTRVLTGAEPAREVTWPPFTVATRLRPERQVVEGTGEEGDEWPPAWRAAVVLPEPSYRIRPAVLAWGAGIAGVLLLAGSAAAGLLLLRRGRLLREREVSPLDQALALLRSARTDEERRAALEALALAVDGGGEPLAEPARQLAWSPPAPSADAAAELAALAKESR